MCKLYRGRELGRTFQNCNCGHHRCAKEGSRRNFWGFGQFIEVRFASGLVSSFLPYVSNDCSTITFYFSDLIPTICCARSSTLQCILEEMCLNVSFTFLLPCVWTHDTRSYSYQSYSQRSGNLIGHFTYLRLLLLLSIKRKTFPVSESGNMYVYFTAVTFIRLNENVPLEASPRQITGKYKKDCLFSNITSVYCCLFTCVLWFCVLSKQTFSDFHRYILDLPVFFFKFTAYFRMARSINPLGVWKATSVNYFRDV